MTGELNITAPNIGLNVSNSIAISNTFGGLNSGILVNRTRFFAFANTGENSGAPTFRSDIANNRTVLRVLPNGNPSSNSKTQFEFFSEDYFTTPNDWHNFRILATNNNFFIDTSRANNSVDPRTINFNIGGSGNPGTADHANVLVVGASSVGVNTGEPSSNLHVVGNANITVSVNTATVNATTVNAETFVTSTGANVYLTAINAYGQANLAYNQANTARNTANAAYNEANLKLNIAGGTINGSLNVSGNLTITGNTKYVNVDTYIVTDPLIYLAANNETSDIVDIGFMGGHNTAGVYSHSGLVRDAGDGTWYLFTGLADEGHENNVVDFANTSLATLRANINANSILLTGNSVATQANLTLAHNAANNRVLKAGDTMTGALNIACTTVSTSNTTGALIVGGGVGITGNTFSTGKMTTGNRTQHPNIASIINQSATSGTTAYRPINLVDTSATIKIARIGLSGDPAIEFQKWDSDITTLDTRYDIAAGTAGSNTLSFREVTGSAKWRLLIDANGYVAIGGAATAPVPNANLHVFGNTIISTDLDVGSNANISGTLSVTGNTLLQDKLFLNTTNVASGLLTSDYVIGAYENTAPGFAFVVAGATSGNRGVFKAARARGTLTSPTVPLVNDDVFSLLGTVYDGTRTLATAGVLLVVDGTVSDNVGPQRIGFYTGTANSRVERVTIKSNGWVGIGTTSPTAKLHVAGDANITSNVIVNGGTLFVDTVNDRVGVGTTGPGVSLDIQTSDPRINLRDTDTSGVFQIRNTSNVGYISVLSNAALIFSTNSLERARISNDGDVGIGTTSPAAKLHVDGTIRANSTIEYQSPNAANIITSTMYNGGTLSFEGNTGQLFSITDSMTGSIFSVNDISGIPSIEVFDTGEVRLAEYSGNVGIGIANATSKLHVSGTANITSNVIVNGGTLFVDAVNDRVGIGITAPTSNLHVIGTANVSANLTVGAGSVGSPSITTAGDNNTGMFFPAADTIAFAEGGSEVMRVDANGNIGIGTTSPSAKLHVDGDANITSNVIVNGGTLFVDTVNDRVAVGTTSPDNKLDVEFNGSSTTLGAGPGTSVNTGARIYNSNTTTDTYSYLDLRAGTSDVRLASINKGSNLADFAILVDSGSTTPNERLRITANGNVGVGTTSPGAKLEVNGPSVIRGGTLVNGETDTATGIGLPTGQFIKSLHGTSHIRTIIGHDGSGILIGQGGTILISYITLNPGSSGYTSFVSSGAETMRITGGNVGIATTSPAYKLEVNGSFAATTKSFVIDHPTKPGKKLRYGSLEGPENGVYARGKLTGTNTIELPDHWTGLVHEDSITVNLTPIGKHQNLYVKSIGDNKVIIGGCRNINCFYTVFAERKDVDKLIVEY